MALATVSLFQPSPSPSPSPAMLVTAPSSSASACSSSLIGCITRPLLTSYPYLVSSITSQPTFVARSRRSSHVVRMAPDEERLTRRSPLDFPIEWERSRGARRPEILPKFSPMKTPLPPPLPIDPPFPDEVEEEEYEEEEQEDPEEGEEGEGEENPEEQ